MARKLSFLIFLAAAYTGAVAAQAPAPAAAPAAMPTPKHSCQKPGEYPGNLASDNQKNAWRKDFVAYVDCVKKFVTDEQALAKPHLEAANAAVEEYNAAVKEYNDTIEKAKGNK